MIIRASMVSEYLTLYAHNSVVIIGIDTSYFKKIIYFNFNEFSHQVT